jgi:hypothetical protein
MLPPESPFKKWWNRVITTLTLYNMIFLILVVCYNRYDEKGFYWYEPNTGTLNVLPMAIDYMVDILFLVDIILTFRTTFFDAENELVLDKKAIARNYMKWWFPIDLVAWFPFELIGLLYPNANGVHVLDPRYKVVRLIRFSKILKQINVHDNVVRVSQMLLLFLVFAHVVGSLWWSIGAADFNKQSFAGRPTGTSWVIRAGVDSGVDPASCMVNGTMTPGCAGTSALGLEYMSSLYWSLTTLIKTPWVHPDTILEKVWASFIVVVGAIIFAAILGNITAMINSFDKSNAQLRDIMSTLHRLIGKYDVPAKLQKRVFMYVQTQWSTTKGLDNQRILSKLPPALRGDILEAINDDLVKQSPIFQRVSHECVRVMLSKLRSEVCLAKETLLAPGQLCSEVYLLVRGVLQGQPADDDKAGGKGGGGGKFKGKMLFRAIEKTGSLVGMRDPFEKDFRYPFHVVAVKQAQMVALSSKDLLEVFAMDNRSDIEAICEVLEKEHTDISQALTRGKDEENLRRASIAAQRRRSSAGIAGTKSIGTPLSDHDEVHSRITVIEDTLRMCDAEIRSIQEHLQLLPQLCELLNIPTASIDDAAASS